MLTILRALAGGILQTVEITASAFIFGAVLGIPLTMIRRSSNRLGMSYTQVLLKSSGPTAPGSRSRRNFANRWVSWSSGSYERLSMVTHRPVTSRPSLTATSPYTGNP